MKTPLTDAQIKDSAMYGLVVPAEFARQLETRLKESEEKRDQLETELNQVKKQLHFPNHQEYVKALKESGDWKNKYDELKNLAMRLRVFAIHYGTHPKRNYQDKLDETLADFDKIMDSY